MQGELFGQLGLYVHAVLEPGELWAGDALSVTPQAGGNSGLPGLALWVNSDDWRDWKVTGKQIRVRLTQTLLCSTLLFTLVSSFKKLLTLIKQDGLDKKPSKLLTPH